MALPDHPAVVHELRISGYTPTQTSRNAVPTILVPHMQIQGATFHSGLHLQEENLGAAETCCPFCTGTNRRQIRVIQENPSVELLECLDCRAVSVSRMPTQEALDRYYGGWYQEPVHKESGEEVTFDDASRFGTHLVNLICRHQDFQSLSILDFGGGDGSLAHAIARQLIARGSKSIRILVVDYNDRTVVPTDSRISVARVATLDEVTDKYDLVIASAIIEHLVRPREIMQKLLDHIQPGGCFYARTPYALPLMKLCDLFGVKWDFSFPGHVHDLGQEFWEQYFTRVGPTFQVLRSRPSIVETSFSTHALRALVSYLFKAPWYLLGRRYKLVGGWEVFAKKAATHS